MSDTVKLIIEIPKDYYEALSKTEEIISSQRSGKTLMSVIYSAVAHGIPLEDVISKIEKLNPVDYGSMFSYESHNGAKDMKRDILEILDNIGKAESET